MPEINVTGASALYMKVDITEVSQNISGNSSTVKFVASMRQTSGQNWNQVPGVDFKVVVNGSTLANKTGFFLDVRGNITQVFYTGDVVIPHNTDGTKSFDWSFWFDPRGTWHTYKPTTLSGTTALTRIARVSNSTLSANSFDFGESFTVYTNQTDPSFTHTISYIRGSTVTSLATGVKTSKSVAIPSSQMSNYTTATTASMKIRTSTYSGSTLVGNYDLDVTVKVPASAIPTIGAVSYTGSNAVFAANSQFIATRDRLKATVANVTQSYSSPIKKYLYRVQQRTTISMEGTTNGATFPTFNFPATGSEVVNIQMAVVDARGRQSAWSTSPAIRVHAYQPPSIGATVITRNANVTTVNVRRNWSVTPLYEGGSTSAPKNTGTLVVNYRQVGNSTWSSTNGGASGLSGNNSSVALTGFAGGTSYEFQIKLTDKFQTTTAPIITLGTEFVPMDIGPKGVGVGKIHSDGTPDLEVGSGGIRSDGDVTFNKKQWAHVYTGDLNNIDRTWVMTNVGSTNLPPGSNYWYVKTIWYNANNRSQFAIGYNHNGMAQRHIANSTTWSPWVEVLTGPNIKNGNNTISNYDQVTRITTPHGNVDIGPVNEYHAHIYTDKPSFYFNKELIVNGNQLAKVNEIPSVPHTYFGVYTDYLRSRMEVSTARILSGIATASGNATSTFNSLGNTVTFPIAFSSNTNYKVMVSYSISSNVTDVSTRAITVTIRNVSRTGFTWDARDMAGGTSPSGGTKYTLHWIATGVR